MPHYQPLSALKIVKALSKIGFVKKEQRGSHIKMIKLTKNKKLVVTIVNEKEISPGVIKSICKQAGITKSELYELVKRT